MLWWPGVRPTLRARGRRPASPAEVRPFAPQLPLGQLVSDRQCQPDGSSAARLRLHVERASRQPGAPLQGPQAEPGATRFGGPEAAAVVGDAEHEPAVAYVGGEAND